MKKLFILFLFLVLYLFFVIVMVFFWEVYFEAGLFNGWFLIDVFGQNVLWIYCNDFGECLFDQSLIEGFYFELVDNGFMLFNFGVAGFLFGNGYISWLCSNNIDCFGYEWVFV